MRVSLSFNRRLVCFSFRPCSISQERFVFLLLVSLMALRLFVAVCFRQTDTDASSAVYAARRHVPPDHVMVKLLKHVCTPHRVSYRPHTVVHASASAPAPLDVSMSRCLDVSMSRCEPLPPVVPANDWTGLDLLQGKKIFCARENTFPSRSTCSRLETQEGYTGSARPARRSLLAR